MKDFNIEKKGYSTKEVDDFIIMQQIENDRLLKEKQARINELREENFRLLKELNMLKEKEDTISKALISSTEKAKEIEETSKLTYSIELKNLDEFYKRWQSFLNELIARYPKMRDFDTTKVLASLKREIEALISSEVKTKPKSETNNFLILLDKLRERRMRKTHERRALKINKSMDKEEAYTQLDIDDYKDPNKLNNIKPITSLTIEKDEQDEFESLVDKFLHTNNKISQGYESSILNSKKKNIKRYPAPNESGFDLEAALNPTHDLSSIMKGFNLDC